MITANKVSLLNHNIIGTYSFQTTMSTTNNPLGNVGGSGQEVGKKYVTVYTCDVCKVRSLTLYENDMYVLLTL